MNSFLVTLSAADNPSLLQSLAEVLSEEFELWAAEADDGLFFISSDRPAEAILELLGDSLDLDLANTLYVFQLSGTWAGFGTTTVREALYERLKAP